MYNKIVIIEQRKLIESYGFPQFSETLSDHCKDNIMRFSDLKTELLEEMESDFPGRVLTLHD